MKINKKEFLSVLDRIAKEIDLNCLEEIYIEDEDFYWDMDMNDLYSPYKEPKLFLGQLSDDLNEVERLADIENQSFSYDLKRISVILTLLSYKTGSDWILQLRDNNK